MFSTNNTLCSWGPETAACRKISSLVFFQYFIPEWNLVLHVWFAPQFNTEHCTLPNDLLYCVIKSPQIPPNHCVLHVHNNIPIHVHNIIPIGYFAKLTKPNAATCYFLVYIFWGWNLIIGKKKFLCKIKKLFVQKSKKNVMLYSVYRCSNLFMDHFYSLQVTYIIAKNKKHFTQREFSGKMIGGWSLIEFGVGISVASLRLKWLKTRSTHDCLKPICSLKKKITWV